jgi:hypothetical protein
MQEAATRICVYIVNEWLCIYIWCVYVHTRTCCYWRLRYCFISVYFPFLVRYCAIDCRYVYVCMLLIFSALLLICMAGYLLPFAVNISLRLHLAPHLEEAEPGQRNFVLPVYRNCTTACYNTSLCYVYNMYIKTSALSAYLQYCLLMTLCMYSKTCRIEQRGARTPVKMNTFCRSPTAPVAPVHITDRF